jgi:hypothetical protein
MLTAERAQLHPVDPRVEQSPKPALAAPRRAIHGAPSRTSAASLGCIIHALLAPASPNADVSVQ